MVELGISSKDDSCMVFLLVLVEDCMNYLSTKKMNHVHSPPSPQWLELYSRK